MRALRKNLGAPDEVREFDKGRVEIVNLDGIIIGRATFEPGWKWSMCVKPIAETESCQAPHTGYIVSGRMHVEMDNGQTVEFGPGDAMVVPPGHDAWVLGNEPCIALDFSGMENYAKRM